MSNNSASNNNNNISTKTTTTIATTNNTENVQFSEQVDRALEEVLQQKDPFDTSFFDPIHYINQIFPNEQALNENLESFIFRVKKKIQRVDEDILVAVRKQSNSGVQAKRDLEEAKETIFSLFKKIHEIKSKAEQSEQMVQNITKDIKSLDYGKRNLTVTITTLGRLHMLVSAVDKLTNFTNKKQYKQAAELLDDVNELVNHFEKYKKIQKISILISRIEKVKKLLQDQLFQDFKSLDAHKETGRGNVQQFLSDACLAVDALGDSTRDQLISQFVRQQLDVYDMLFRDGKEDSKLDNIDKRYKWIKKQLKFYEERYSEIFPDYWSVRQEITVEFCLMTRRSIEQMLQKDKDRISGKVLYKVILSTLKFEREMQERFYDPDSVDVLRDIQDQKQELDRQEKELEKQAEELQDGSIESNEILKRKFKVMLKKRELEKIEQEYIKQTSLDEMLKEETPQEQKKKQKPKNKYNFMGFISSCFEEYMGVYIQFEEESMRETLSKIIQKETWDPNSEYSSSQDLFMYIVESMKSCMALSRKKTLFDLVEKVFKKYLRKYSDTLLFKLPKVQSLAQIANSGGSATSASLNSKNEKEGFMSKLNMSAILPPNMGGDNSGSSGDGNNKGNATKATKVTEREELTVFYIMSCADYCQQNIEMVEEQLREALQEPYCYEIDLSDEQGKFYLVLKTSIEVLVTNLMNVLDKQFVEMSNMPWATMDTVGDQSSYISVIMQTLKDAIPFLATRIPSTHFKFFCDTFLLSFMSAYVSYLYRCKKISSMGAQQLLVDFRSLTKYCLRDLLILGDPNRFDEDDVQSFAKKVDSKSQKIESILRTLSAPTELILETYLQIAGPEASSQDLSKILDLKDLQKNDKQIILDSFQKESKKISSTTSIEGNSSGNNGVSPGTMSTFTSAIKNQGNKMEQATSAIFSSMNFMKKFNINNN
ncbi:hypothetical protein ABK040_005691 [Willaertia magna]